MKYYGNYDCLVLTFQIIQLLKSVSLSASSLPNCANFIELRIWNCFKVQVLLHIKKEHCLPNFTIILFNVDVKFYSVLTCSYSLPYPHFIFNYIHVCLCVHVSAGACRSQKRAFILWNWSYKQLGTAPWGR